MQRICGIGGEELVEIALEKSLPSSGAGNYMK